MIVVQVNFSLYTRLCSKLYHWTIHSVGSRWCSFLVLPDSLQMDNIHTQISTYMNRLHWDYFGTLSKKILCRKWWHNYDGQAIVFTCMSKSMILGFMQISMTNVPLTVKQAFLNQKVICVCVLQALTFVGVHVLLHQMLLVAVEVHLFHLDQPIKQYEKPV